MEIKAEIKNDKIQIIVPKEHLLKNIEIISDVDGSENNKSCKHFVPDPKIWYRVISDENELYFKGVDLYSNHQDNIWVSRDTYNIIRDVMPFKPDMELFIKRLTVSEYIEFSERCPELFMEYDASFLSAPGSKTIFMEECLDYITKLHYIVSYYNNNCHPDPEEKMYKIAPIEYGDIRKGLELAPILHPNDISLLTFVSKNVAEVVLMKYKNEIIGASPLLFGGPINF